MPNDDLETEESQNDPGRLRRMYEDEARARADAQAELAQYKRSDAFRSAGLDMSKPLHQTVAKAYDGDLDGEKVREYVNGLGLTQSSTPAPPAVPDAERQAIERMSTAAAGETPPPELEPAAAYEKEARELMQQFITRGGQVRGTRAEFEQAHMALAQKHSVPTTWDQGRDRSPY